MSNKGRYRYPGTRPFETDEQDLFFGRSEDSKKLYQQVLNEKTVLLYAKSGLGKSSVINAGLLPFLTQTPGYKIFQVRFGNYNAQFDHYEKPLNKLISQINSSINPDADYLDKIIPNENSLWYRFKQRQQLVGKETLLFIFDQFEELLTYPEEDIFHFKKQFAHLLFLDIPAKIRNVLDRKLDKDPALLSKEKLRLLHTSLITKALFAIRSDRMSELNRIANYFPNILKTYYELKPLDSQQAKEAIVEPARRQSPAYISPVFSFKPILVERIIQNLEDEETHTIESFQLQMVCRYAEDLVVQKKTSSDNEISEEDLGDIQSIFAENYRRLLTELPAEFQDKVHILIEEKLIVAGNRVPLPEIMVLQQEKIPQNIIDKLLNSHLLRAERNSTGGRSIELSHDTLIAPVTKEFEKRQAAENLRLEKKQAEEEAAKRQQELEAAKREAETERKRAEEQALLRKDAEQAKDKARRNLRFVRVVAVIALIVAVVAVYFYTKADQAISATKEEKRKVSLALEEVKKQQAFSKARELKSFGDSYKDLQQTTYAMENYKAAFETIRKYPDESLYKELKFEIETAQR